MARIPERRAHGFRGSLKDDRKRGTEDRKELEYRMYLLNSVKSINQSSCPTPPDLIPEHEGP